ncbi:DNA-directed RNA polymerase subunit D [Candidatus Marsarchaeota G2 archaeon OSP_D]|uniref:DNA-directed RNA polymerase subunit Rpo3 n=5 Tax=Candidatus Marsarchaeota group 2 TaxID=2203771 RepID=A0A2R6CF09_9ARCH|nr:MAG: DNA-directed RNA polymerase subunit D [Candidatus Marsarchaeota G2 archaeon OSP_D]PSN96793.1 MAG: DNA-directed RNA polymerase subunit D [Candidatus Marsarchaeota G2 archaeon ECH_B_2]PSO01362.1 MAG: DNA-directed RNA polymerase subunit D [Candidatus Marsarchaeota G2 archaeon ECH_B_3]PSO03494.1 MAG: DNA-directed RNA polymerase subunit D [Candidatus Marsarchaeota G2 archaeon ECH_B_1]PSO09370.1 MAG: DNA-directed RNA polymerase subunit D [Candidatus Marsarchaeota G2 archaeon BE_D]
MSQTELSVKVIEDKPGLLTVEFSNLRREVLNGIRRTILAEVPTLAIDEVLFTENSSPIYGEYIAHRLGMVPIKTPDDPEILSQISIDIQGGNPPNMRVEYQLRAECPPQLGQPLTVSSDMLKPLGVEEARPVYDNIQLFKLGQNQVVELQATARYGLGKQHAKFSPVSPVVYIYKPVLIFDKTKDEPCDQHVSVCPTNCLEYKHGELVFTNPWDCILCRACEKACKSGATKIMWDESVARLTIEATGSLPPKVILKTAILILLKKFKLVSEKVGA